MSHYIDFEQEVRSIIEKKGLPYLYELIEVKENGNKEGSTKKLPRYRIQLGLSEEEFSALKNVT